MKSIKGANKESRAIQSITHDDYYYWYRIMVALDRVKVLLLPFFKTSENDIEDL